MLRALTVALGCAAATALAQPAAMPAATPASAAVATPGTARGAAPSAAAGTAPASAPDAAAGTAPASEPGTAKIAILSLVGDRLTVVVRQDSTGSVIDQNRRTTLPLAGRQLDDFVLEVADNAIRAAFPGATPTLLRATGDALYAVQDQVLDAESSDEIARLQSGLRETLAGRDVDRLLLVLKARGPAEWAQSKGKLEGLGFFVVPPFHRDQRHNGAPVHPGTVSAYAGLRVLLLDARSLAVLKEDWTLAHTLRRAPRDADTYDEWRRLTPEQKDAALRQLLRREIRRMVPPLFG
jgi:hypothetical protein